MQTRKIYRSNADCVFAGVCGGLGEYFNIDPVIVRIIWVVVTLMGGAGILAYIIAWLVIPKQNDGVVEQKNSKGCLYAILILILAIIATSILVPIINVLLNVVRFGTGHIGLQHTMGVGVVPAFGVLFMAGSALVTIAAIVLIVYLIKKAGKRDE